MRTICISIAIFFSVALLAFTAPAQQPRRALFQTFTNSFDECPLANGLDAAFKQTLASSNGAKIIHLNHHIANVGDPMVVAGPTSNLEIRRLTNNAYPYPIFNGAVDHTLFSSTGTRVTSMFEPSGASEWNARIAERVAQPPIVAITLSDIKLDRIGQAGYWRIVAKVKVTLQSQNSEDLKLFYAITEDGVYFKQCESTKPVVVTNHDNVVRFIETSGIPLDLKNKIAGASDEETITHDISKHPSFDYKLENMRLVAFVERGNSETFEVVQSWTLRENFDTLAIAPQAISISSTTLDGMTYAPEDNILISFDKTSIDSVNIEFSSDNGGSWQSIAHVNNSPYYWIAPDITTMQGKIRVSDLLDGTPSAASAGNFTIELPSKRIKIIKPAGGDTAFINKKFTIEWSTIGINEVKLEYSTNGGTNWILLSPKQTGTTYAWNLTGTYQPTEQALVRITELTSETDTLSTTSNQFYIDYTQSGSVRSSSAVITDMQVRPQPVGKGKALTVELNLAKPSKLEFSLFDMSGKQVYHTIAKEFLDGSQTDEIELPNLPAGAYLFGVTDSGGSQRTKVIRIE